MHIFISSHQGPQARPVAAAWRESKSQASLPDPFDIRPLKAEPAALLQ
jgi:hypothetical protein